MRCLKLENKGIEKYLEESDIIDYSDPSLIKLVYNLVDGIENTSEKIKVIYEFVRDEVKHSYDIDASKVTCIASDVFKEGHGVCYAKSHLLVALLRSIGIPSGFCYQGLVSDDTLDKRIILHGLVGVYVKEIEKWIRLDARGNKPGVEATFSLTEEKLAFPLRQDIGEYDMNVVFSEPSRKVIECLLKSKDIIEVANNLPESI